MPDVLQQYPGVLDAVIGILIVVACLCLTVFLAGMLWHHRRGSKHDHLGQKAPERTFFSPPETGELTPGMNLFLHVIGIIAVALFGYEIIQSLGTDFSNLETGKVQLIKVHSVIAWAYHSFGASGTLALTWVIFIVLLLGLGGATRDAYRTFRQGRQSKAKRGSENP